MKLFPGCRLILENYLKKIKSTCNIHKVQNKPEVPNKFLENFSATSTEVAVFLKKRRHNLPFSTNTACSLVFFFSQKNRNFGRKQKYWSKSSGEKRVKKR